MLLTEEANARFFQAATGEDLESLRPEYDYEKTQEAFAKIEKKIRKVKHAINLFNLYTQVEGMSIDELLVYLPQLKDRKSRLLNMISRRPKQRARSSVASRYAGQTTVIDYEYANYAL